MTDLGRAGRLATSMAALISLGLASGCTGDDEGEVAAPDLARDTASASPLPTTAQTDASCKVKGFVPTTPIVLRDSETVVAYVHAVTVAPGPRRKQWVTLERLADKPAAWPVQGSSNPGPEVLRGVARSLGDVHRLPEVRAVQVELGGAPRDERTFIVYETADQLAGTWRHAGCGGTEGDGTVVRRSHGRFRGFQDLSGVKIHACGDPMAGSRAEQALFRDSCGPS